MGYHIVITIFTLFGVNLYLFFRGFINTFAFRCCCCCCVRFLLHNNNKPNMLSHTQHTYIQQKLQTNKAANLSPTHIHTHINNQTIIYSTETASQRRNTSLLNLSVPDRSFFFFLFIFSLRSSDFSYWVCVRVCVCVCLDLCFFFIFCIWSLALPL